MSSERVASYRLLFLFAVISGPLFLVLGTAPAFGQAVIATVAVGKQPNAVAVNPITNKIYVLNSGSAVTNSGNVTVIDGKTNSTITVTDPNASFPTALAVNSTTNKIYVANGFSNNITVIDGATNSIVTVTDAAAVRPSAVAVNPMTNKIYVANGGNNVNNFGNITVIDGATNSITTVTDPHANNPYAIAVNPVTNRIYAANTRSSNVTVIDGSTNTTSSISAPVHNIASIAVNSKTNKVYITQSFIGGAITVINGATNSATTVKDPNAIQPQAIAVNPTTDKIYVANNGDGITNLGNVTVIDGSSNFIRTITDPKANQPIAVAVNSVRNQTFVKNLNFTVTAIDGATRSIIHLNTPSSLSSLIGPSLIAVNDQTDRVYVVNYGSNNVTVIAGSQTQASCSFIRFPLTFNLPSGTSVSLTLGGINDFGSVVGTAVLINNGSGTAVPFIRWSNGGITFPLGKRPFGSLVDRNDSGISIGFGGALGTSFILLRDGTVIPIPLIVAGGFNNNVPIAEKINKWESIVGEYPLLAGQTVGFKRWKNGSVVSLDNPWIPLQTHLGGINDNGVIVGTAGGNYGPQLSHGLIFHKGSWAQLDYPGVAFTRLSGISNSGVIIGNGNTIASQFGAPMTPFLYENGAFKVISPPNTLAGSASVTGISLKLGMIVGSALNLSNKPIGFIAKCL